MVFFIIEFQMGQVGGRRICDEAARSKSAGAGVSWAVFNDQLSITKLL